MRAGPHRVTAAFIKQWDGPVEDVIAPIEHTLADTQIGSSYGITTLPHLRDLIVSGPYDVTGLSDTPSRRIIFTARPISADDEMPVATSIVSRLATRAYRRPITGEDLQGLMAFYETGATEGDFESGIRLALQAILASPHFVFRLEEVPDDTRPGENYRITDVNLASRLSYFLWASIPDEELMSVARQGKLSDPEVLEQQVRRMLGDRLAASGVNPFNLRTRGAGWEDGLPMAARSSASGILASNSSPEVASFCGTWNATTTPECRKCNYPGSPPTVPSFTCTG